MRTYVIVCFLSNPPKRFLSEEWPLHLTIIRPFRSDRSPEEFGRKLEPVCGHTPKLVLTATEKALFGPKQDVKVTKIELTPELQQFQQQILRACHPWITFKSPMFSTFNPHITEQKAGQVEVGERVIISSLSLVEQTGSQRTVRTHHLMDS